MITAQSLAITKTIADVSIFVSVINDYLKWSDFCNYCKDSGKSNSNDC
jgi:hypothetical protein